MLELFSGSGRIAAAFHFAGWETVTVDWDESTNANHHLNILDLSVETILEWFNGSVPGVVWASPECTTYSIATSKHRTLKDGLAPLTPKAEYDDKVNRHLWRLIDEMVSLGSVYFVENPRGRMRHMDFTADRPLHETSYCTYGLESQDFQGLRKKDTDIWTNHAEARFNAPCRVWNRKHEHVNLKYDRAKDTLSRSQMPSQLIQDVVTMCENLR